MTETPKKDEALQRIVQLAKSSLSATLEQKDQAVLALSGGGTPTKYLPAVFSEDLDWLRIQLVLVDERWVPPDHPESNEGLINSLRANQPASAASLVSLWSCGADPHAAAQTASHRAAEENLEIDLAFLGMGDDGHTASLFPADAALKDRSHYWIAVEAPEPPNVPLPRLSLSRPALMETKHACLVFTGQDKLSLWQRIESSPGQTENYPVAELLSHHSFDIVPMG